MATADSRTPASTPRMPTTMLRRIGRSAYRMSATIAVVLPTPPRSGIGRRKPKTARLGTVCTTFTTPRVQRRSRARRTRITADGAAIATATNTATATSHRCSADNLTISASGMRFVGCPLSQSRQERHRLWRSRLHKLIRPGHNFQPPFLQQRDPGAEHERFADVVGDEKRGLAEGLLHPREALLHLKPRHRVERRERFIQQQQGRICRQRAGDSNPLPFAPRKLFGPARSVFRRGHAHGVKQLDRAGSYAFLRPAFQLRNQPDVLSHGRVREKAAFLDHVAHTPPQANRVPVPDGLAFEPYFATRGLHQPVYHFEQRRLPRAAPPQQRHRFALFDAQVDAVENLTAAALVRYSP